MSKKVPKTGKEFIYVLYTLFVLLMCLIILDGHKLTPVIEWLLEILVWISCILLLAPLI